MDQRASPFASLAWPALACLGALISAAAASQEPEGDPLAGAEAGAAETATEVADPCASEYLEGRSWIDWLNRGLHRTACETALWFDHLFGDYRLDEKLEATYGRAFVGVVWDEDYGFEDDLSFRARLHFPNMERRLNAFIGRDDREDLLEDAQRRGATSLPRMFDPRRRRVAGGTRIPADLEPQTATSTSTSG